MGRTFHLDCSQCHEYIWIGQTSAGNSIGWLYAQEALPIWRFLRKHAGHPLIFDESQKFDYADVESTEFEHPDND